MRLIDADALLCKMQECHGFSSVEELIQNAFCWAALKSENFAPTVGCWISVKDGLPKVGTEVLLAFPHNMAVGCIDPRGYWKVNSGDDWYTFVADGEIGPTHWMPLPEGPKEVNGDADKG